MSEKINGQKFHVLRLTEKNERDRIKGQKTEKSKEDKIKESRTEKTDTIKRIKKKNQFFLVLMC